MFNLIARRIDRIRVRATLRSHRPTGKNVGSPLDKLDTRCESVLASPPTASGTTTSDQIWAATTINRTTRPLVTPATMNPMIAINHSSMGQT